MTGILKEIPSHFTSSQIDGRAVWSKSTPKSMTIPCHSSRFYLLSMLQHDMDFRQVQVMELSWHLRRKWWDFHRIWSHFRPNARQKDMRKYKVSHFLQGYTVSTFYIFSNTSTKYYFSIHTLNLNIISNCMHNDESIKMSKYSHIFQHEPGKDFE